MSKGLGFFILILITLLVSVKSKPGDCGGECGGWNGNGCTCLDFTFTDWFGTVHGNCVSPDPSGMRWCYVSQYSSCYLKTRSQRYFVSIIKVVLIWTTVSPPPPYGNRCPSINEVLVIKKKEHHK